MKQPRRLILLNLKCIRDRYAVYVLEAVKNAIVIFNVTGKFEDILCYSKNKHKKMQRRDCQRGIHKDPQNSLQNRHSFNTSENGHTETEEHPHFAFVSAFPGHISTPGESPLFSLWTRSVVQNSILDFLRVVKTFNMSYLTEGTDRGLLWIPDMQ